MSRISPADDATLEELAPLFEAVEQAMGFVPESFRIMARVPGLPQALAGLAGTVQGAPRTAPELKALVALMVSRAAGCRYCQAHTAHTAHHGRGVDADKVAAVWEFETSDRFSEAERAALRVALGAGQSPSAVTDEEFAALRSHFDDDQVAEIVGMIALFGFLNRWNDTLGTDLEAAPLAFARETLAPQGWEGGRHVPERGD
jgi:uncharacterized peroxidase-related enzyme